MGQAPEPDSTQLALIERHHHLALAADEEITRFVQASGENYALYDNHTWLLITDKGDEDRPLMDGEEKEMHLKVYDLRGRLLEDTRRRYRIGKMELPVCIEHNMEPLRSHSRVKILAPWYAAFGAQGTSGVPPYTNVMIDLEIQ